MQPEIGELVAQQKARGVLPARQLIFPVAAPAPSTPAPEKHGVVYTKRWVVDLILDLAGYTPDRDLAASFAVEPAAGTGAFLIAMVERLLESCRHHGRPISDTPTALLAYELDDQAAEVARERVGRLLRDHGVAH